MGPSNGLKFYGYGKQGGFGDNPDEAPSWLNLVERLKWNAWDDVRGMSKLEARELFMAIAIPVLK